MESAKQEILDLEDQQVDAFNEGDMVKLLSFFDADLTGFSSTRHMRLASLNELKDTFEYYLSKASKIEYSISDPGVTILGDTAILTFYWTVRAKEGRKMRPIEGRGTHVYTRRGETWKIVHEHFSRTHRAYEKK